MNNACVNQNGTQFDNVGAFGRLIGTRAKGQNRAMSATPLTKRAQIADQLRRGILSGELARGSRLLQDDLATRFGVSITPVREALSQLEVEGLVVTEQNRGVRVAAVDIDQVTAAYVIRRLTETYAVQRATLRMSRRDLARARALLEQPAEGLDDARDRNSSFHFLFYEHCGMPALTQRITANWQAFPWDLTLHSAARSTASRNEHLEILTAVETGDPQGAADATARHIRNGFTSILVQLTGHEGPDPFDLDSGD